MRDATREACGTASTTIPRVRAPQGGRGFAVELGELSVMSDDDVDSGYLCGGCGAPLPIGGLVCEGCGAGVGFDEDDGIDWEDLLGASRPTVHPDPPRRPRPAPRPARPARPLPRFAGLLVPRAEPALAPRRVVGL